MAENDLWDKKNYLIDLPYIISTNIYEYDIRKANINVLRALNYIDQDYYNKLNSMSRMDRQVEIGYMIRNDSNAYKILDEGIKYYKKLLFEANNLEYGSVLSIKNDAVFIIGNRLKYTSFKNEFNTVEFVLKNDYTSYYKIQNLEIYFKSDMINGNLVIDVKGLGEKINLHRQFIGWIAEILSMIEVGDLEMALSDIQVFYNQYISRSLPIEFYRQLDPMSMYIVQTQTCCYGTTTLPQNSDKSTLNINCNLQVIRILYGYVSQLYLTRKS